MAEPITTTFTWQDNGETKTLTDTYSVKEYLDALAEKSKNDVKTLDLINALRNYGHYIQPYLKRINKLTYTEMPKAESVDVNISTATSGSVEQISNIDHNTTINNNLITNVQIRLNINSGTDLMFEFKLADGVNGTVTARVDNDDFRTISPNSKGVYRISKQSLAPNNLEIPHTFEVKVGNATALSTTASVMDYISIVLNTSKMEDEKLALAALYEYWAAAEAY